MNRQDRDRYNDDDMEYGRYQGYNREDAHYHSARNLTNEFEREYQRDHGHRDAERIPRTYHEGDMGDAYERRSREEERGFRWYSDVDHEHNRQQVRNFGALNRDRDNYSTNQGNYRRDQDMHWSDRDRNQERYGNTNQGHYSNTNQSNRSYGRYDSVGSDDTRGNSGGQDRYADSGEYDYRSARYTARNYGGGSGYAASQGRSEASRYGSDRDRRNDDWFDQERNRYY